MEKYKFLEHTADLKVQAFGKTLEEVFINSSMFFTFNIKHPFVFGVVKSIG